MPQPERAPVRPLIILAPPRSFSSVAAAMLGQHPEMYSVAETQLFSAGTVGEWFKRSSRASFPMRDGLLRAVAELLMGEQTERTIVLARHWLAGRSHWATPDVFRVLAARVAPRTIVEKSPTVVYEKRSLDRIHRAFPRAWFIHLGRHPAGYGQSVLTHIRESRRDARTPAWLAGLAGQLSPHPGQSRYADPQRSWLALQQNIVRFLRDIPKDQQLLIRGEDLLTSPQESLTQIAEWLGLRTDEDAIDEMLHPESSPFACLGPPNAQFGNDIFFLRHPELRPARSRHYRLTDPLPWRDDGSRFLPEVIRLARSFGYE